MISSTCPHLVQLERGYTSRRGMIHLVGMEGELRPIISTLINVKKLQVNAVGNLLEGLWGHLAEFESSDHHFLDSKDQIFNGNFADRSHEIKSKQRLLVHSTRGI